MAEIISIHRHPTCGAWTGAEPALETGRFFFACPACKVMVRPDSGNCARFCTWNLKPVLPLQQSQETLQ